MRGMFGLMRTFLGRIRYRRRWGELAAAAEAAADKADADLDRHKRDRRSRRGQRRPHRSDARATDGHPTGPPPSSSSPVA
jgi:hypothetical protein